MIISQLDQAAQAIADADTLLIAAGAGMGVESGLPDFCGSQGFWQQHPVYGEVGLSFADLANPDWFFTQPERAWGFYGYRYNLYRLTPPHAGFQILKKWQKAKRNTGFVYTSNVDGHFQAAGFSHDQIYECHGSINYMQCLHSECNGKVWPAHALNIKVDPRTLLATNGLPRCPDCGMYARPNVLMFNDWDWLETRAERQRDRFENWRLANEKSELVIIEIGAGVSVGRVRSTSQAFKGTLIRINPRNPEGPDGTISLAMPALAALQAIDEILQVDY